MQYKNIIFDLGNVLVRLNPEGCIGAFKAIEMGKLANPNPQSEGMKLMSKLGVGMITTEAFCDAARELTGADVLNSFHACLSFLKHPYIIRCFKDDRRV